MHAVVVVCITAAQAQCNLSRTVHHADSYARVAEKDVDKAALARVLHMVHYTTSNQVELLLMFLSGFSSCYHHTAPVQKQQRRTKHTSCLSDNHKAQRANVIGQHWQHNRRQSN